MDSTIGTDNRQWLGAANLPADGIEGTLDEPGEARWFRFPVVPGQRVSVDLSSLPADYDVALYGDIESAFTRLRDSSEVTQLAAASAAGAPGAGTQVPDYPSSVSKVPTLAADLPHRPPLVLTATLTQAGTARPLAGQPVVFKARRLVLCQATTDAQGTATCDLRRRLVEALTVLVNSGYEVTFAGSPDYAASQTRARL